MQIVLLRIKRKNEEESFLFAPVRAPPTRPSTYRYRHTKNANETALRKKSERRNQDYNSDSSGSGAARGNE